MIHFIWNVGLKLSKYHIYMHPLIEAMFVDSKNGISDACSTADMFIFFHPNWDWIGLGWQSLSRALLWALKLTILCQTICFDIKSIEYKIYVEAFPLIEYFSDSLMVATQNISFQKLLAFLLFSVGGGEEEAWLNLAPARRW